MISFVTALAFVLCATPGVKKLAFRLDIVDRPNRASKIHRMPIPLLGGLGILLVVLFNSLIFTSLSAPILAILAGGTIIGIVGMVDDMKSLSYKLRLAIQIGLATLLAIGFDIRFFGSGLDWLLIPLSILWMVGLTNSFNFIDNMDGSSGGVALISSLGIAGLAYFQGDMDVLILALSLGGASLGFLVFNFKPASIFLGDMGSMFLGFTLSSAALYLSRGFDPSLAAFFIFPFLLGLPIFDTCLVTWIRYRNGVPIYTPDRNHVTFQFVNLGLSQRRAVLMEYAVAVFLVASGLLIYWLPADMMWTILPVSIVSMLILAQFFVSQSMAARRKNVAFYYVKTFIRSIIF